MKRVWGLLMVGGLLAGGTAAPRAHEGEAGGGGKPEEMHLKMMKKGLDLSDAQVEKLKAAMEAHAKAEKPLRRMVRDTTEKLKDQLEDNAGEDALKPSLDQLAKARQDMRAEEDRFHDSMRGILTVTQQAKMAVMHGRMGMGPKGMPSKGPMMMHGRHPGGMMRGKGGMEPPEEGGEGPAMKGAEPEGQPQEGEEGPPADKD